MPNVIQNMQQIVQQQKDKNIEKKLPLTPSFPRLPIISPNPKQVKQLPQQSGRAFIPEPWLSPPPNWKGTTRQWSDYYWSQHGGPPHEQPRLPPVGKPFPKLPHLPHLPSSPRFHVLQGGPVYYERVIPAVPKGSPEFNQVYRFVTAWMNIEKKMGRIPSTAYIQVNSDGYHTFFVVTVPTARY